MKPLLASGLLRRLAVLLTCACLLFSHSPPAIAQDWAPSWFHSLRLVSPADLVASQTTRQHNNTITHEAQYEDANKGLILSVSHDMAAGLFLSAQHDLKAVMEGLRQDNPAMAITYSALNVSGATSAARADAVVKSGQANLYLITLACTTGLERWMIQIVAPSQQLAEVIANGQVKAMRIDSPGEFQETMSGLKPLPATPVKPVPPGPVPTTIRQSHWTITFPDKPILVTDRGALEWLYKVPPINQPLTYWLDCSATEILTGTSLENNFQWRKDGYEAINTAVGKVHRGTCNGLPFIEFETGGTQTRRHRILWLEPNIAVVLLAERPNGSPWPQAAQSYFDSFEPKK